MKNPLGEGQTTHDQKADQELRDGAERQAWQAPRLRFVKPQLTERGSMKNVAGGFFGPFSP